MLNPLQLPIRPPAPNRDAVRRPVVERRPALRLAAEADASIARLRYHGWRRHLKRTVDIVATAFALPAALPLMAVVAVMVKLSSPGPILFRQDRVGRAGETFRILKFRTMHVDADERLRADPELYAAYVANDYKLDCAVDPRVPAIGQFLRKSSLDELPQLFNVLAGSMSLVGPRPIVREELGCYGDMAVSYFQLRPGLTGLWQVEGRNIVRYPERAHMDHDYLYSWRFRSDLSIMARTVPLVLGRRGCH